MPAESLSSILIPLFQTDKISALWETFDSCPERLVAYSDATGTLLHYAATYSANLDTLIKLLELGIDVNVQNRAAGDTVLHLACRRNAVSWVQYLMQLRRPHCTTDSCIVNFSLANARGEYALDYHGLGQRLFAERVRLYTRQMLAMVDDDYRDVRHFVRWHRQLLDINAINHATGNALIHHYALAGNVEMIGFLVQEVGANAFLKNSSKKLPYELTTSGAVQSLLISIPKATPSIPLPSSPSHGKFFSGVSGSFGMQQQSPISSVNSSLVNCKSSNSPSGTCPSGNGPSGNCSILNSSQGNGPLANCESGNSSSNCITSAHYDTKDLLRENQPGNIEHFDCSETFSSCECQGYLQKWTNYASGYKHRWFVLSNGILSYYKNETECPANCRGSILLRHAQISQLPHEKCRFSITNGLSIKLHLRASSEEEAMKWVLFLKESKNQTLARRPTNTYGTTGQSSCVRRLETQPQLTSSSFEWEQLDNGVSAFHKLEVLLQQQRSDEQIEGCLQSIRCALAMSKHLQAYIEGGNCASSSAGEEEVTEGDVSMILHDSSDEESEEFYDAFIPPENSSEFDLNTSENAFNSPVKDSGSSLYSRGFSSALHRDCLPFRSSDIPKVSLWSFLKGVIGKDLTRLPVPVNYNEPLSMLQRMAEDMQYSQLLKTACSMSGSWQRIQFVAAFAISNYASTDCRLTKPFNPLLGETFEFYDGNGLWYFSEQVSHHPPVSACIADSPLFTYWSESAVRSSFKGRYLEIIPEGTCHLLLKVTGAEGVKGTREHYSWKKVKTTVQNILFGTMSIEHTGVMHISNHTTKESCLIEFKPPSGHFVLKRMSQAIQCNTSESIETNFKPKNRENSNEQLNGKSNEKSNEKGIEKSKEKSNEKNREKSNEKNKEKSNEKNKEKSNEKNIEKNREKSNPMANGQTLSSDKRIVGHVLGPNGEILDILDGYWNSHLHSETLGEVWRCCSDRKEDFYNFSSFTMNLNTLNSDLKHFLPPTDSRLRPDQRALEFGNISESQTLKGALEQGQRERKKMGIAQNPRWFERVPGGPFSQLNSTNGPTSVANNHHWRYLGGYWESRGIAGGSFEEIEDIFKV